MDTVGHGTHVAGIVASANAHAPGVVPDANVIAHKITPDGSLTASVSSIVAALEWVVDHRQLYNIVAVNISFGSGSVAKGSEHAQLDPLYRALADSGVFVAVAAGNSYSAGTSSEGLNFLASSHSVVAVGAVWDSDAGPAAWGTGARDLDTAADRIASFSQRSIGLDLLAPGADILNLNRLGGLIEKSGTSMAAPFVAGTATLLREAADATGSRLTASDILDLMQVNAAVIHDGDDEHDNVANTNRSFHRIDALAALSSLIARDQAADLSTGRLPTLGFNSAHASINRSPAPDRRATEAIDLLLEATL
jgi:subtilisin family serine protease